MTAKTPMNYIDSYYFNKWNKIFFLTLIIFQLLQSMGFNGLFDLPQLFMILLLMAFFSFRKSYKVEYGLGCIFLSFYIQYALTLKLLYNVLIKINYVQDFMDQNSKTNIYVKWASIMFG
jgi:hypothetical protein